MPRVRYSPPRIAATPCRSHAPASIYFHRRRQGGSSKGYAVAGTNAMGAAIVHGQEGDRFIHRSI